MVEVAHFLTQANLAHYLIELLEAVIILSLILRFILQFILRGQENRFSRFLFNVTAPVMAPLERVLPPITLGGVSISIAFFVAWWGTIMVGALLFQSIPAGW
ncbi:MAG TPA: YggT family protein [Ktedonobacterales bacterium]|jgi:uncharacterized protein YggT (Ycf19 family)|nr:YggT family protein [Ktedonobacterales bacterium]